MHISGAQRARALNDRYPTATGSGPSLLCCGRERGDRREGLREYVLSVRARGEAILVKSRRVRSVSRRKCERKVLPPLRVFTATSGVCPWLVEILECWSMFVA